MNYLYDALSLLVLVITLGFVLPASVAHWREALK